MYQEEYLPQENVFHQDIDNLSVSVSSYDDSTMIHHKIDNKYRKLSDSGYKKYKLSLTRKSNNSREQTVIYRVESFATNNVPGALIRHAKSGLKTNHRVGSSDADLYFSVMDLLDNSGRKLYYNTPEEYEIHFKVTLPLSVKNAWYEKKINKRSKQVSVSNEVVRNEHQNE
jgi:hypothetical protein